MAPFKPTNKFSFASKLFASFKVKNVMTPTELTVHWYRGGDLFGESTISVDGNGRFSANVESPKWIALGKKLGKGSMPKRETTKFKKGVEAIYIGLRFLDLKPNFETQYRNLD